MGEAAILLKKNLPQHQTALFDGLLGDRPEIKGVQNVQNESPIIKAHYLYLWYTYIKFLLKKFTKNTFFLTYKRAQPLNARQI